MKVGDLCAFPWAGRRREPHARLDRSSYLPARDLGARHLRLRISLRPPLTLVRP
jgi:hypothetical protein